MGAFRHRLGNYHFMEFSYSFPALWLVDYPYQCIGLFINSMVYRGGNLADIEVGYLFWYRFSDCLTGMGCDGYWITNFDIKPVRRVKREH